MRSITTSFVTIWQSLQVGFNGHTGFEDAHIQIDHIAGRCASPAEFLMQEVASSPLAGEIVGLSGDARAALVADVEKSLADFVDDDGIACSIAFYVASAVK
ncbi:MAG: hypothetical protein ACOC9Y_01080 [Chloroflexota bacterium]